MPRVRVWKGGAWKEEESRKGGRLVVKLAGYGRKLA